MYKFSLAFATLAFIFSCQTKVEKNLPVLSPEFTSVLDAHGEWQKWFYAEAESYAMIHEGVMVEESAFINLDSRKIRLSNSEFEIGFDGNQVWISPNREAYKGNSVMFYHNLYFYFYNIPYIFTDPGVTVQKIADRSLNGKKYSTFQATFEATTGASPDDEYFMLINPESNRLEYLLYTVTYFGNENPRLSALKYEDYRNSNGVYFPRILTGYSLANDSTQNIKFQVTFADALLHEEKFDENLFEKPSNGVFTD